MGYSGFGDDIMVSKVAVIAIIGILAVPILLGYALNLEQTTETDYQTTGDSVNVTQLLQSGTDYTYAKANIHQLNTSFKTGGGIGVLPFYSTGYEKTSLFLEYNTNPNGPPLNSYLPDMNYYLAIVNGSTNAGYIKANVYNYSDSTLFDTISKVRGVFFDSETQTVYIEYDGTLGPAVYQRTHSSLYVTFEAYGTFTGTSFTQWWYKGASLTNPAWVDFAAGYNFTFQAGSPYAGETHDDNVINFPNYTRSAIITLDLDSITEPNYKFGIGTQCYIEKTTTGSDVSWQVKPRERISNNTVPVTDLYYDPSSSNNTYQIKIWIDPNGEPSTLIPGYTEYIQHYEFRYVGAWPSLIGEANYFQSFDVQAPYRSTTPNFNFISIGGYSDHSPRMRVDDAEFRAMEYQVIADKTYDPAAFKTNPATTINDPVVYGPSFTFGGITYAVKKGNITMGSHDIPVKGLVLSSVPNEGGGYDNKIGNTVISTTAAPSAITFNGKWSASISTIAQEEYQVTKTEWKAGSFAWDGMDQNFLMVGLLASLGAFVALGIYARRSRATIWPLLIVCGGAALLFFVML